VPSFAPPDVVLVTIGGLQPGHVGALRPKPVGALRPRTAGALLRKSGPDPAADEAGTPTLDRLVADGTSFETVIAGSREIRPAHASIQSGRYPPGHGVRRDGERLPASVETLATRLSAAGFATRAVVGAAELASRSGLGRGFDVYDDPAPPACDLSQGLPPRSAFAITELALSRVDALSSPFLLWVHYGRPDPRDGLGHVDEQLARLLERLRETGHLERALVAVIGDRGEPGPGYALDDATLRVPLLLHGPGVPVGRRVPGVVRSVDLTPTLLALSGLDPLPDADGEDLAPLWSVDARPAARFAYAETLAPHDDHGLSPLFAIRTPRLRYVRAPRPELYALTPDGAQRLLATETETDEGVAELDARIEFDARIEALFVGRDLPDTPDATRVLGARDPKEVADLLDLFAAASQAFDAWQLGRARTLLETLVVELPTSVRSHALLARVHLLQGHPERARGHAEAALALRSDSPELLALRGDVQAAAGEPEAAESSYRAAALGDPNHPAAQLGFMRLNAEAGQWLAAEEHARRALQGASNTSDVHGRIARIWEGAGDSTRALAAYQRSLRLDPDCAQTHMHLAVQYARMGRPVLSQAHVARAGAFAERAVFRQRLREARLHAETALRLPVAPHARGT
jgi:tetratricopeptide (TPR) repeat protein